MNIKSVMTMGCLVLGLSSCDIDIPNAFSTTLSSDPIQSQMDSQIIFDSSDALTNGVALAQFATQNISGGTGWCYRHVAQSIHHVYKPFLYGEHAYMAASQLALSPHFQEVFPQKLDNLPAGAVVVWEKGSSTSGHISIANGKGSEISDHIAPQMKSHYGGGSSRVFLPR